MMGKPKAPARKYELAPIGELEPYDRNARTHSEAQVDQLAASISEFGFTNPVLADEQGRLIAGHGRLLAARKLGMDRVPCIRLEGLSDAQRRALIIADNQLAINAGWDEELLASELAGLLDEGFELDVLGFDSDWLDGLLNPGGDEEGGRGPAASGKLADEFLIAPFSVLNSREGWWQDRKRAWLALGIRSEVGRGENLLNFSDTLLEPDPEKRAKMANGRMAANFQGAEGYDDPISAQINATGSGTSIFDPVLCELAYRWFCPRDGLVLDPFAGGSVRGIVAAKLGRSYVGIDLRPEQCAANEAQAVEILGLENPGAASWLCGDSGKLLPLPQPDAGAELADFLFSCPPYGDLEQYSDDPLDLSNMELAEFISSYRGIVSKAVASLKNDRFACFVVGDYRDAKGFYCNFIGETISAFEAAGARLYNEAVLVTSVGSLAIRAGRTFRASRKLGKTHQNILVFCKGDPRKAVEACGPVNVDAALDAIEAEPGPELPEGLEPIGGEI